VCGVTCWGISYVTCVSIDYYFIRIDGIELL